MAKDSSDEPTQTMPSCNQSLELVFWILYGSTGVVILTGNVFTFIVFASTKRLRQSYMNVFLLSLAVADVLMAVFVVPYTVLCKGCISSKYCWFMSSLKDIALGGTVFSLAAISVDRFLAVVRPLRYQNYITTTRVTFILIGIWCFSCTTALLRNAWLHTETAEEVHKIDTIYNSILIFAFALLPILIILGMNLKIIQAIRRQSRRVQQERNRDTTKETNHESQLERSPARKGTLACVLVVFVFLVSWLPLAVTNFSFVFGRPDLVNAVSVKVAWLFLFLQSSANPFIYSFCRSEFRQAAFKLICCKFTGTRAVALKPMNEINTRLEPAAVLQRSATTD